jgi:hypothetical protein
MFVTLPVGEGIEAGLYNEGQTRVIPMEIHVCHPVEMYNICGVEHTSV